MRSLVATFAGALGALALATAPAAAQQRADGCAAPLIVGAPEGVGVPVVIVARVHADALVFDADPDVRVTLNGCEPQPGQLTTTSNLPDTIVPGVRYTDVEVTAEYRAVLTLECRPTHADVVRLCEELRGRN